uniref:Putative glycosylation-dependent cell adhesion molecule 1 n=1 Tax=Homo sapiens TaxID=9606 RepID=GLCM1_HUMAN|nr:PUTATIVE PSEUDOGENE: RecName: Full=Putative glycosylation-dependent cell adhesion molecule 1; Short=GlyCAM-1; Flags: Precursor [Homo sapiens]CAD34032.1 glycosylation-dependent cell adhesion molecule 1 [Homo sapiens]
MKFFMVLLPASLASTSLAILDVESGLLPQLSVLLSNRLRGKTCQTGP